MKKRLSLESIESDPDLIKAEILAQQDIDKYLNKTGIQNPKRSIDNFEVETEVEIRKRIAKAEVDMVLSGVDDISEKWVKDFEKRKSALRSDKGAQQIVEYVRKSEPYKGKIIQCQLQLTA